MNSGSIDHCQTIKVLNRSLTSYGVGNVTDMDGMGAFLSTEEETKWDSDNGCVYKIYTMSEMSG